MSVRLELLYEPMVCSVLVKLSVVIFHENGNYCFVLIPQGVAYDGVLARVADPDQGVLGRSGSGS